MIKFIATQYFPGTTNRKYDGALFWDDDTVAAGCFSLPSSPQRFHHFSPILFSHSGCLSSPPLLFPSLPPFLTLSPRCSPSFINVLSSLPHFHLPLFSFYVSYRPLFIVLKSACFSYTSLVFPLL